MGSGVYQTQAGETHHSLVQAVDPDVLAESAEPGCNIAALIPPQCYN